LQLKINNNFTLKIMNNKNLTIIFLTTLMAVLGVASITPAFPTIIKHFGITPPQVALLITVFTIPGVFLAPVLGILADRFGRKIILIPSLLLFGIAGGACFFIDNWEILLVVRFFQGIGGAALGLINVTLIGDIYEGKKRSEMMGYNASVLSIGTALYPAIGGLLAMAGWQFPFLLPMLALPAALLAFLWLKTPEPYKKQSFKSYLKNTWNNINRKTVWGIFIINVLLFFILYGAFLSFFPQLMKERFDASALYIGIIMSGFSVITAITSSQKRHINRILSVKKQIYISLFLYMVAMLLISASHQWWQLFFPLVAFGLAQGMLMPEVQTLLVGFAPLNERAGFMSVNSMVLRLGQSVGPLFIGLFYALGGVATAFVGGAAVAVVMLLVAIFMVKV